MIFYDNKSWWRTALYPNFAFLHNLFPAVIGVFCWSAISYYLCVATDFRVSRRGFIVFGSAVSFLTVFRVQKSYDHYMESKTAVAAMTNDARDLMRIVLFCTREQKKAYASGEVWSCPSPDLRECWINTIRLTVALMVCVTIYSRTAYNMVTPGLRQLSTKLNRQVEFDLSRLRGLVYEEEFELIQKNLFVISEAVPDNKRKTYRGLANWIHYIQCIVSSSYGANVHFKHRLSPAKFSTMDHHFVTDPSSERNDGKPFRNLPFSRSIRKESTDFSSNDSSIIVVVACLLTRELHRHVATDYGYYERSFNVFDAKMFSLMGHFQFIMMNVTMPFPIILAQLNKIALLLFVVTCPFVIDTDLGAFANIFYPTVIAFIYFSIEAAAIEIEVCFGEDDNDMNILDSVHQVECECVQMLSVAEHRSLFVPAVLRQQRADGISAYPSERSASESDTLRASEDLNSMPQASDNKAHVDDDDSAGSRLRRGRGLLERVFQWVRAPEEYEDCEWFLALKTERAAAFRLYPDLWRQTGYSKRADGAPDRPDGYSNVAWLLETDSE